MKLSLTLITISYLSLLMIGCNENYSFEVAGNDINNSASDSLANTYVNDTNLNPLSLLQFLKSDSSCFTSAKLSKLTEKKDD